MLTHTGVVYENDTPEIPGFICISCAPRRHYSKDGGVAIYAKTDIPIHQVIDVPELGMAWARVNNTHLGVCYIPHEKPSYYKSENGKLNADVHFQTLSNHICKFQSKGSVISCGDFNSRVGMASDVLVDNWDHLVSTGIPVPIQDIDERDLLLLKTPPRNNKDTTTPNRLGRKLLNICHRTGLIITNGRFKGDTMGDFTFHADGRQASSVIDYFIASPSILDDPNKSLRVTTHEQCPRRPGGKSFDHMFLTLRLSCRSIPFDRAKDIRVDSPGQQTQPFGYVGLTDI